MKSYTITVNGNVYDVTVEETERLATAQEKAQQLPAAAGASSRCGSVGEAGAAGKVFKLGSKSWYSR